MVVKSEGEKKSDRSLSSFRWRSDIAPGVFYQSDTLYSSDAIKEIDLSLEQKFGLGYRFINEKNFKLSTGMGLNGRYRDDSRGDNTTYLVDLFEDIDYRLNQRFRITQEFSIALPPEDSNQYEIQFQTGVVSKITDSLHMSVRYQLEYDRSQPKDRRNMPKQLLPRVCSCPTRQRAQPSLWCHNKASTYPHERSSPNFLLYAHTCNHSNAPPKLLTGQ